MKRYGPSVELGGITKWEDRNQPAAAPVFDKGGMAYQRGPEWLFEIKLDGYRAVAVKSDRGVNLFNRIEELPEVQCPPSLELVTN